MKLKFSPLPEAELERRLEALRNFRNLALDRGVVTYHDRATPFKDALNTSEEVAAKAISDLLVAAAVAERSFKSMVASEAVSDLLKAAKQASLADVSPVVILTATLLDRKSRTYNVTTDTGEIIVSATDHPLADGAAVIAATRDLPENARVALFFAGKTYPAFGPMKLCAAAALGIVRQQPKKRTLKPRQKATA